MKVATKRISFLDIKEEETALVDDELLQLCDLYVSLHYGARVHATMS
jgi:hypothetical protein